MEQKSPTNLLSDDGEMSPMLVSMKAIRDTMPKYDISLMAEFPLLTSIQEPIFIGSFAWTSMYNRWKIIKRAQALSVYGHTLTPADVARDYIRAKYEKPGRITSGQYEACVKVHRAAPLYAQPCTIDNAIYLDLKSAYWSILQIVGWDVEYNPNRWLGVKSSCSDFPFWRNKMARNCLVSVGMIGDGKRWTGEKLEFVRKSNPLTNMVLYSLVQDVLNGVASDMVRAGALYVHTDGYILPLERMEAGMNVLADWGLVASIRHQGHCQVFAVGTYEIGEKKCARAIHRAGEPFNNISVTDSRWLRTRFANFARKTKLTLA